MEPRALTTATTQAAVQQRPVQVQLVLVQLGSRKEGVPQGLMRWWWMRQLRPLSLQLSSP